MQETLTYNQILDLFKETSMKIQETDRILTEKFQETDLLLSKKFQETDKQIKELSANIGGLNNSYGSFSESLFIPSIKRLLTEKFNCSDISSNRKIGLNGNTFEIDVFGISNDSLYIVEIKSKLNLSAIKQIHDHISNVRKIKTEYKNRKIYGIIAAVDYEQQIADQILKKGYYFVTMLDNLAVLNLPESFKPMYW
jgi:hypothetical protein